MNDMLDLVRHKPSESSSVLQVRVRLGTSCCRSLERKLTVVEFRYGGSDFERQHYALLAIISVYGIELSADSAGVSPHALPAGFEDFAPRPTPCGLAPRPGSSISTSSPGRRAIDDGRHG